MRAQVYKLKTSGLFTRPHCLFCHVLVHIYSQVTVLGTPAEEAFGGKIDLIDAGAFSDVDIAMMAHPAPEDDSKPIMIARERYPLVYYYTTIQNVYC